MEVSRHHTPTARSGSNLIEYGPTNQSVVIGTNIVIPCEVSADYKDNAHLMWFINVSWNEC